MIKTKYRVQEWGASGGCLLFFNSLKKAQQAFDGPLMDHSHRTLHSYEVEADEWGRDFTRGWTQLDYRDGFEEARRWEELEKAEFLARSVRVETDLEDFNF